MSFGKLYSYSGNPRTTSLLAVAKENGLDIEFVDTEPAKGVSEINTCFHTLIVLLNHG